MGRRDFIATLGSASAVPLAALVSRDVGGVTAVDLRRVVLDSRRRHDVPSALQSNSRRPAQPPRQRRLTTIRRELCGTGLVATTRLFARGRPRGDTNHGLHRNLDNGVCCTSRL